MSHPGWYPDPWHRSESRYFDGSQWTMHVSRGGVMELDAPSVQAAGATVPQASAGMPVMNAQALALAAAARSTNGLAVASLTLGIVGTVFGLIPLLFFISFPLGLLALVLGAVALAKSGRTGRRGMSIAGVVLGLVALTLAVIGVAIIDDAVDDFGDALGPATADEYEFTLDRCEIGEYDALVASGAITNTSGGEQSFAVTVEFLDANGVRVADGFDYVSDLADGQTATWEANGFHDVTGAVTCDVTVE